jgi:hypothetical protein
VFVCKSYYFEYLIKELGINNNTSRNTTYKPTSFDKDEILANHRSFTGTLMLNDYMSRWDVLKRRVGAVTSQRVLKVLFYVNILQCFFVVENFTANAVSVAIGDNGNRLSKISGILDLTKEA